MLTAIKSNTFFQKAALVFVVVFFGVVGRVWADPVLLTHQITIQPIFLNNGSGYTAVLSNPTYTGLLPSFKEATQKIFSEAQIRVNWLPEVTYTNSGFYKIDGVGYGGDLFAEMKALTQSDNIISGLSTSHGQSSNSSVLNVFFTGSSGSVYGVSEQSYVNSNVDYSLRNGVTIAESVFQNSMLDVVAHEIGHSAGLYHYRPPGNTVSHTIENLMYAGSTGITSLGNIYPDGLGRGRLTSDQQSYMLRGLSTLEPHLSVVQLNTVSNDYYSAVPEYSHFAMFSGVVGLVLAVFRRKGMGSSKKM